MIEAALKDFLQDKPQIRKYTGRHIYAGRIPREVDSPVVIVLRKISAPDQHDDLPGQDNCVGTIIQVECFGKGAGADVRTWRVAEEIRKATAKDCYRGQIGLEHSYYVHGMTIERESSNVPVAPVTGDKWTQRYSQDLKITHNRD